jgi:hypothetical protein
MKETMKNQSPKNTLIVGVGLKKLLMSINAEVLIKPYW